MISKVDNNRKTLGRAERAALDMAYQQTSTVSYKAKLGAKLGGNLNFLTHLYDLAMDCLRLSMHFFHPIQQCAQQVYHTAVPLSPTSSEFCKSYLRSIANNQLAHVTAFLGAPRDWGSLLRTIDTRPRQPTCIATSGQRIISACEDTLNIYDAVTGLLQQSIYVQEIVVKIKPSPNGSILFLAHSSSITMWDVQTGGLIHTFITQSKINDIAVSTTHIACGSSDGSVTFWNTHTKEEGEHFGNDQPVVTIYWLSAQVLVVASQGTVYTQDIMDGKSSVWFHTSKRIWGMVYLWDRFLIGIAWQTPPMNQELYCFVPMSHTGTMMSYGCFDGFDPAWIDKELVLSLEEDMAKWPVYKSHHHCYGRTFACSGQFENPTLVDKNIVCITPVNGVQLFNPTSHSWTETPALMDAARSVAMSLGRNIVVQTYDSIQIFSIDALTDGKAHKGVHISHIYPLGEKHVICVQSDRSLILLELETMQKLHPDDNTSPLQSLLANLSRFNRTSHRSPFACASFSRGLVARLGILSVMQAWQSGTPLPEWTEVADEDVHLSGLSPKCTRVVTVHSSPRLELRVDDVKHGIPLADSPLEHEDLEMGMVYDLGFNSETRFYLKIAGPEQHVQVPYKITPSPSEHHSHKLVRGEPVHLSEPRATPPYTLDANCEWVLDAESRKVCWISPGDLRRGDGGHFWTGTLLVMVGDDGVMRKLSFKEPGC